MAAFELCRIGLILLGMLWLCPCGFSQTGTTPVSSALDAYERWIKRFETTRFQVTSRVAEKGGAFRDWQWTGVSQSRFARVDGRWRLHGRQIGLNYYDGKFVPFDLEAENTFDGKIDLIVNRDSRDARQRTGLTEEEALRGLSRPAGGEIQTTVLAELDAPKARASTEYMIQNNINAIYGYLPFDRLFVRDLLQERNKSTELATVLADGRRVYELKCVTKHGRIRLSLDPERGCAPVRIEVEKLGSDLLGGKPLNSTPIFPDPKTSYPNRKLKSLSYVVDYRFAPGVDGELTGFLRKDRFIYDNDLEYILQMDSKINDLNFHPDPRDVEPTIPIPEGTQILVRNSPSVHATWEGGKVVYSDASAKPDVPAAGWKTDPGSTEGSSWPGLVFLIVVSAVSVALAGFYLRKRSPG